MHEGLLRAGVLIAAAGALLYHVTVRNDSLVTHQASAAVSAQDHDDCISAASYHEAVAAAVRSTDWSRLPHSADLPFGTRSMMSEFLLLKQLKRSGQPPCPDLAPLLEGVRVAALPHRAASDTPPPATQAATAHGETQASRSSRPDAPQPGGKRGEASAEERRPARMSKAVVIRAAHIRSQPSKSAEIVGVARQGATFEVYGTKYDWVQVGNGSPEGWIAGFLVSR